MISASARPLSAPENNNLDEVLKHPGFIVLQKVVASLGAYHAAQSVNHAVSDSPTAKSDTQDELDKALCCKVTNEILDKIRDQPKIRSIYELKPQPQTNHGTDS